MLAGEPNFDGGPLILWYLAYRITDLISVCHTARTRSRFNPSVSRVPYTPDIGLLPHGTVLGIRLRRVVRVVVRRKTQADTRRALSGGWARQLQAVTFRLHPQIDIVSSRLASLGLRSLFGSRRKIC